MKGNSVCPSGLSLVLDKRTCVNSNAVVLNIKMSYPVVVVHFMLVYATLFLTSLI